MEDRYGFVTLNSNCMEEYGLQNSLTIDKHIPLENKDNLWEKTANEQNKLGIKFWVPSKE